MESSDILEITNIKWTEYSNFKIKKCYLEVRLINTLKFLDNINVYIKNIFHNLVISKVKYDSTKSRIGLCFIVSCLEYPVNVEYCKLDEFDTKLKTINDRFMKVGQSSKLNSIDHFQIIFTF